MSYLSFTGSPFNSDKGCNVVLIFWSFCLLIARLAITFDEAISGVACNLDSRGFHVLCKATEEVVGHVKPYSITGSLPLIRELQVVLVFSYFLDFFCEKDIMNLQSLLFFCNCRRRVLMYKLPVMVCLLPTSFFQCLYCYLISIVFVLYKGR